MKIKRIAILASTLATMFLVPLPTLAQTEHIINGSFEDFVKPGIFPGFDFIANSNTAKGEFANHLPGWYVIGFHGLNEWYPWIKYDNWVSPGESFTQDGSNYINILYLRHEELSQTFAVTAGIPYTVSWFARARNLMTNNNQARIELAAGTAAGTTSLATSGLSLDMWSQFSFTFTPDTTTTATLYFDPFGDVPDNDPGNTFGNTFLDSVSVIAIGAPDTDGDGVVDDDDYCDDTVIPEAVVSSIRLAKNRWALMDDDLDFDTNAPRGQGPNRSYSTTDTAGCSCEQIAAAQGLGDGQTKFGCSKSVMDDWVLWVVSP